MDADGRHSQRSRPRSAARTRITLVLPLPAGPTAAVHRLHLFHRFTSASMPVHDHAHASLSSTTTLGLRRCSSFSTPGVGLCRTTHVRHLGLHQTEGVAPVRSSTRCARLPTGPSRVARSHCSTSATFFLATTRSAAAAGACLTLHCRESSAAAGAAAPCGGLGKGGWAAGWAAGWVASPAERTAQHCERA